MRVVLEVTEGPLEGRRIPLQAGEIARFGSGDIADVCFSSDQAMSEVHFAMECAIDRCLVRNIEGSAGTLLNDQLVSEAPFQNGDVITAGQTSLLIAVEGDFQSSDSFSMGSGDIPDEPETKASVTAEELCEPIELEELSQQFLRPEQDPQEFIQLLVKAGQFADAIRVLTLHLPKVVAIRWAHQCVSHALAPAMADDERAVLDSVMEWLEDPTDKRRRIAMQAAQDSKFRSAASWVGLAAFWSEGSMAPADLPDVPPEPHLCGQGVSAALLMTATQGDATTSGQRFESIVGIGMEFMNS